MAQTQPGANTIKKLFELLKRAVSWLKMLRIIVLILEAIEKIIQDNNPDEK